MTETLILTVCFLITFGFIGYKLFGIIKKTLNDYSEKIENSINESELLKQQALSALDDAMRRKKFVNNEIEENNKKFEEKLKTIKDDFNEKLLETKKKIIEDNNKKMKYEKESSIEVVKNQIIKAINDIVNDYIDNNLSKKEKEEVMQKALSEIDFKKLTKED